jgi:Domain of unknown function (DUF305)
MMKHMNSNNSQKNDITLIRPLIIMFVGSFVIQYYFMSSIMSNSFANITNSVGKLYLSTIMGISMVILEILMMQQGDNMFGLLVVLFFTLGLMVYLYKNQVYINEQQYLNEMIEHHSMALLTSRKLLEKANSGKEKVRSEVINLANNIVVAQEAEINQMKNMV